MLLPSHFSPLEQALWLDNPHCFRRPTPWTPSFAWRRPRCYAPRCAHSTLPPGEWPKAIWDPQCQVLASGEMQVEICINLCQYKLVNTYIIYIYIHIHTCSICSRLLYIYIININAHPAADRISTFQLITFKFVWWLFDITIYSIYSRMTICTLLII